MPITLLADSGEQAGDISLAGIGTALTVDSLGNQIVITAVADNGGNLKLVSWKVSSDGKIITRLGHFGPHAGTVDILDIAGASNNRFVTAVRASNGKLLLIGWQLNTSTGAFTRLSDSADSEGAVSLVAMCQSPLGDGRVLIAVRDGAGNLVVKNWEISSSGELKRVGDTALQGQHAGAISHVAIDASGNHVYTAVRDSGGNLKIIVWEIISNGAIKRVGDSGQQGEEADLVEIAWGAGYLVTAIRDSGKNLKLILWKISSDGKMVTRVADSGHAAGGIDRLSCAGFVISNEPFGEKVYRVVTAVRTKDGSLKLIVWQIAPNGAPTRIEDFGEAPGPISLVRISPTLSNGIYVTTVRDNSQDLRLITWRMGDQVQPEALSDNVVLYNKSFWENTVQVIAPKSPDLPKGKIVVHLGQPRSQAGFVHRDLLGGTGTTIGTSTPTTYVPYPLDASSQTNATDNQIIRLQDNSLLATKNGYVWSDLTPRPAWFDMVDVSFTGAMGTKTSKRARNAVLIFRSTDEGESWTLRSLIDAAVVDNGHYGWPQGDGKGKYGVGGFDRTELYQDPSTGAIYISGHGDGGPFQNGSALVSNHAGIIFVSKDNAKTWNTLHKFIGQGKGDAPYLMTSTSKHPLIVLQILNSVPMLYWLDQDAIDLSAGKSVALVENGKQITSATDTKVQDLREGPACIARINTTGSRDQVWIAYPALNSSSRQVYRICAVTLGGTQDPVVEQVVTIQAEDPTSTSAVLGAFVQDDRVDKQVSNPDNLTLFYWIDAPPQDAQSPNNLLARYKMLLGVKGQFQSGYLSVASGQKRYFGRTGIGDYFKGGFFDWNGKVNLLAQWNELDAIKGNVVSIVP